MVTGLAAVAAGTGAQITFSLSAPATVEVHVRNIAGRLVRTVTPGQDCAAGLSTLVWNCQSDAGLRVPNGIYLVEVCARSASGSQSRALATVSLR
jgi:flagellar hook assembly protein FlgD